MSYGDAFGVSPENLCCLLGAIAEGVKDCALEVEAVAGVVATTTGRVYPYPVHRLAGCDSVVFELKL